MRRVRGLALGYTALPLVVWSLAGGFARLDAQDVEMLGRRYGTRPPDGYYRELAANPDAFRFTRGRAEPGRMLEAARAMSRATADITAGGPARALGPRGPVSGTYRIPVVLGLFSDSPQTPPFTRPQVQTAYFDDASGTVRDYYDEVSGGALTLLGETRDWQRSSLTQSTVTQGQSSLVCCGIGNFIKSLLALQTGVNWGLYDNDGPDGVPNSGDDDGYVDALAVIHPTHGAECGGGGGGGRIWAHKWTLSDASSSGPYVTSTPSAEGGFIRIEDYFVQGAVSCDQTSLNEIGVFAHETGHAFGLPDLYDTRASGTRHSGAGNWDIMSSGTWGCDDDSPQRPCHMGAWSKAMLGWVNVTTLPADTDLGTLTIGPVETDRTVYRVDAADGSNEYFLLENRQRIGYDDDLWAEGLLVWQIDQDALDARWASNSVNGSSHMAVWLRQADGLEELSNLSQDPGDAGDPFPGQTGKTVFHAGSNPRSTSFQGGATGLTILDVDLSGDDVDVRLLTRFTRITLTTAGTTGPGGLFTVDGDPVPSPPANVVLSAPFGNRVIEAAAGEATQPGERRAFLQWTDAPAAPRSRLITTPVADVTYEATYGGTEYQLGVTLTGGVNGVAPGMLSSTPGSADLWFPPSTSVQLTATPQVGFAFDGWTGALAGQPNPASVVLNAPVFAGASFHLTYVAADVDLSITATVAQDVQLAASNGTSPIAWQIVSGALPAGLSLSGTGRLTGMALDLGAFPLTVQATDALGLTAQADVALTVVEPTIAVGELLSQFLLAGPSLGADRRTFLDHQGNDDGDYDLGDLRSWILGHPSLPLSAALEASPSPSIVVVPLRPKGSEEEEGSP